MSRMKRGLLTTSCLIALTGVAHADPVVPPLPSYDVIAFCKDPANRDSTQSENQCVYWQYYWRKRASEIWLVVTPSARSECMTVNEFSDYSTLFTCVDSHKLDSKVVPRSDATVPSHEGDCASTKIARLEHRLESGGQPITDSGSEVVFTNGLIQVSYDELDAVHRSRVGDPVSTCLISIPRNCPPGDVRGRRCTTTNLRD